MMGRMDVKVEECSCGGQKKCQVCKGTGRIERCMSCGEIMPCSGTEPVFDQSYCSKTEE